MFTIYQLVQDFAAIHSMSPFNPQSSAEITVLPRGCHVQPRCLLQTPHLKNVMARCCTYVRAIPPWQKIQLINPKFFVCLPGSNEMIYKTDLFYIWLVVSTPLKKSQLGLLFPIYISIYYIIWKLIKNVPNHQPVIQSVHQKGWSWPFNKAQYFHQKPFT